MPYDQKATFAPQQVLHVLPSTSKHTGYSKFHGAFKTLLEFTTFFIQTLTFSFHPNNFSIVAFLSRFSRNSNIWLRFRVHGNHSTSCQNKCFPFLLHAYFSLFQHVNKGAIHCTAECFPVPLFSPRLLPSKEKPPLLLKK